MEEEALFKDVPKNAVVLKVAPKKPPRLKASTPPFNATNKTTATVPRKASKTITWAEEEEKEKRPQIAAATGSAKKLESHETMEVKKSPKHRKQQLHSPSPAHMTISEPTLRATTAPLSGLLYGGHINGDTKTNVERAIVGNNDHVVATTVDPLAATINTLAAERADAVAAYPFVASNRKDLKASTTTTNTNTTRRTTRTRSGKSKARVSGREAVNAVHAFSVADMDVKKRLARGCTSLMYACQHGDIVQVLEQLRSQPERIRQRDSHNKNALHYCAVQDAQTRDLVAAASIAIAAPELLESADEDGFTPLHLAVIQGNLAMVNLLLANKADVNAVDNEGHSVVHWATVCGEVEALRSVLAAGANVATPDINGGSPLHYAAQMCGASYENKLGQVNSAKLALEILGILLAHPHTSVDVEDKDGRQPLLWAASAGSAKAVIAMVKAGARVESADKDGLTALHCAASRGHTECIDTLISLCGAPTDLIDSNGCTALHYAVTLGHADATSRLLDLDADPNRQDRKGRTPAHCGCSKGQFETVKLLKERGANLWLRNAKGDLPVHEAASSGRRELVEWLLEQRSKQVNTTSNDGRSLLHIAAANDYTDMCKMLLDYGADINAVYRNSKGTVITPLDCALQKGHRSTAKFLQSHGGLPAAKLRLAARRSNPFQEATSDSVKPLKYVEKEELHDLRNSKKYVVYLKHSDSEGGYGNGSNGSCSCTEQTYRKEKRYAHTCQRHRRSRRQQARRRTSSCGEAKGNGRHDDCTDICRSKSNIEIRRKKSREHYGSSSEWTDKDEDEDSCENCCYHKKQKQRVLRRRSTSSRRSKSSEREEKERSSDKESSLEKREKRAVEGAEGKVHEVKIMQEQQQESSAEPREVAEDKQQVDESPSKNSKTALLAEKGATFIKSPPTSPKKDALELTDDEGSKASELVTTKVDVHREADAASLKMSIEGSGQEEETGDKSAKAAGQESQLSDLKDDVSQEVEQVVKMAALAVDSESKNGDSSHDENLLTESADRAKESAALVPEVTETPATPSPTPTPMPTPLPSPTPATTANTATTPTTEAPASTTPTTETTSAKAITQTLATEASKTGGDVGTESETNSRTPTAATATPSPIPTPAAKSNETNRMQEQQEIRTQAEQQQQREQESRRSFTLLPSDSADDEDVERAVRKSSFQILKSDESVGEQESPPQHEELEFSDSQVFKIVSEPQSRTRTDAEASSAEEADDGEEGEEYAEKALVGTIIGKGTAQTYKTGDKRRGISTVGSAVLDVYDYSNGRKRRLKKRVKSGSKTRSSWDGTGERVGTAGAQATGQSSRDQDSGFEPSPRAMKTKIPTPRNVYTAQVPRKHIYATMDGRSCSSRLEGRKPGDKGACDMSAVTRSIQRNIRRYYMERKIFQHLLELKSLQIRSNKLNEAVLVKRAVDDYHKSCAALGGETGTRLRRYTFSEYTFKNFELFLYETLKSLQKPGTYNFQNINEVYEEAERRLSPDYNAYEKALQCTTKTHRCLHAAHAYTGIPCAAYIPMMNHHTMPKFGFGPYKKTGVGSFYLPKILSGGSGGCSGGKVALELSHGKNKQLISLPSDKLDSNKRYYVTFTVKETGNTAATHASNANTDDAAVGGSGGNTTEKQPNDDSTSGK